MTMHLPQLPKTISEYCQARDEALRHMADAHAYMDKAKEILNSLGNHVCPTTLSYLDRGLQMEGFTKAMDSKLWQQAFTVTGFMAMMDSAALNEFRKQVDRDPPPFTEDTIRSTFLDMMQNADMMFARGVVNVFRWLSDEYKTNSKDPFRIGERVVMRGLFELQYGGGLRVGYSSHACGQINDIDRVFHVLDGKKHQPHALESSINQSFHDCGRSGPWVHDDDYFQIKGFKNRNAHILFKRADLLDKVNQVIGKAYGSNALAERG